MSAYESPDDVLAALLQLEVKDERGQSILDGPRGRGDFDIYIRDHHHRFWQTLRALPELAPSDRVLELGAAPYQLTWLLATALDPDLTLANCNADYGSSSDPAGRVTLGRRDRPDEERTFDFLEFNVETDPFPYDDGSFDLVLCCELIEHLAVDPSHLLAECHRILAPGGRLFVTTPNAVRWETVGRVLRGDGIGDQYSGQGVYGRHNREYTAHELEALLEGHHFQAEVRPLNAYSHGALHRLLTRGPFRGRSDNLFALATSHGTPVVHYPSWLYRSIGAAEQRPGPSIRMGQASAQALQSGWIERADTPRLRWTGREAQAVLWSVHGEPRLAVRARADAGPTLGEVWINDVYAGGGVLEAGSLTDVLIPLPPQIGRGTREIEVRIRTAPAAADTTGPERDADGSAFGLGVERIWLC